MTLSKIDLIFAEPELSNTGRTLLFLMPLVQTAWAHGAVSPREKYLIFTAARADSIDERDAINDTLDALLKYQPSAVFFDDCLALIVEKLRKMPVRERTEQREKILRRCRDVAAAAGEKSPMDLNHHTSSEEKSLLEFFEDILK